jgi:hypothetical protein
VELAILLEENPAVPETLLILATAPPIAEGSQQALACCAGWLLAHARIALSDEEAKRGIFNMVLDLVCADRADITFDKLQFIETTIREAFAREGRAPSPSIAQFFNSSRHAGMLRTLE